MANQLESSIYDMIEELNLAKKETLEMLANSRSLCRNQVNVLSCTPDNVIIKIDLNDGEDSTSSVSDVNVNNNRRDGSNDGYDNSDDKLTNIENSNNNNNGGKQSTSSTDDINLEKSKANSCANESLVSCDNDCTVRQNNAFNIRSLRRTISESSHEEHTRGILKYPRDWNRRTVSESCYDLSEFDHYLSSEIFDLHLMEESYSEDDVYTENKPKKNVRFAESVSKTVYRANSSILGRRLKNQKRARNRKNSKHQNPTEKCFDGSNDDLKHYTQDCPRSRQDSGYDSEDTGKEEVKLSICSNKKAHIC